MDRQEIRDKLASIIAAVNDNLAGKADLGEEASIRDGLGLDSLQIVELLFEIEEQLDVKIEDEEAAKLSTVSDLLDLIQAKMDAAAGD